MTALAEPETAAGGPRVPLGGYMVDTGDEDCDSCGEGLRVNDCPVSPRKCGHHCNHSWSHDSCCWCGKDWHEGE